MRLRFPFLLALLVILGSAGIARAGVLGQIRDSISSLWGEQGDRRHQARAARTRAASMSGQAEALHDRLEDTQRALQAANQNYSNYWRQMRRTQRQIQKTERRIAVATARYQQHRALFGRRLAAMQRSGKMSYLQLFLGSRTLSDLTRRAYLFNTITSRDAELQGDLRDAKAELEAAKVQLGAEWHKRAALQDKANRERERIARAAMQGQQMLKRINSSRLEMIAYSNAQTQSSNEIGTMIGDLESRRAQIIQEYEEQAARERAALRASRRDDEWQSRPRRYRTVRRYERRRVARRVQRIRYVPDAGGVLKPMAISQLEFHTEKVAVDEVVAEEKSDPNAWGVPVSGRVSSRFGRRYHPILHREKMHTGEDMAAKQGTPFRAAHGGRVLWSGWKKAYGNTVIIDHGNGTTTLYGHASKLGVRAGQPVKAGEYIGNVGSTGWSTGPHLHFEVRKGGKPVNPKPYLKKAR